MELLTKEEWTTEAMMQMKAVAGFLKALIQEIHLDWAGALKCNQE